MKKLTIKEAAVILSESNEKTFERIRASIYNKLNHGLEHEIKDGRILVTLEDLKKYEKEHKQGRPPKQR
ncbi:MAG TPA: hypothetical protein PLD55_04390 [bacterium]|nr:hypothetical protein [bacterium]